MNTSLIDWWAQAFLWFLLTLFGFMIWSFASCPYLPTPWEQHAILKPFMLRRVKKDVVSELTGKTEITVHCKLSSRQQAFYQAIKNKISLAELFDGNRGHLNEKKILNLMNIVIQLRKVSFWLNWESVLYSWHIRYICGDQPQIIVGSLGFLL